MSLSPRDPSPPVTLFCIPNGGWITPLCPGAPSPARRSPPPGCPRPSLARGVPCDCRVVPLEAVPRAVVAPDTREGEPHDRHERLLIRKPQAMFPVWNPGHGLVYARQPSDRVAADARRRPPDALLRAPLR